MEDFEFIDQDETAHLAIMLATCATHKAMAGHINELLNEKCQKGFTFIGPHNYQTQMLSETDISNTVSTAQHNSDTHNAFVFLRPIKEEPKAKDATWEELQDVLKRYKGCTSCGSSNANCYCERDE